MGEVQEYKKLRVEKAKKFRGLFRSQTHASVEKAASALCDINLIKAEQGVPILTKSSPLFL